MRHFIYFREDTFMDIISFILNMCEERNHFFFNSAYTLISVLLIALMYTIYSTFVFVVKVFVDPYKFEYFINS